MAGIIRSEGQLYMVSGQLASELVKRPYFSRDDYRWAKLVTSEYGTPATVRGDIMGLGFIDLDESDLQCARSLIIRGQMKDYFEELTPAGRIPNLFERNL